MLEVPTVTVDDLCAFHVKHFPHAPTPEKFLFGVEQDANEAYYNEEDDSLGYYPDGTKRTLTNEQIAMFRHSEIRNILNKRKKRREAGENSEEGEVKPEPETSRHATDSASTPVETPTETAQPISAKEPKTQQWATSSARTKARNKKHRDKYRARLKRERVQKENRRAQGGDEESDEWDPWHQATGPDAQKDDAIDLDY